MRQQPRPGQCRARSGDSALPPARCSRTSCSSACAHLPNHHETGGHVLQHLRHIFAQLAQLPPTLRTHRFFRLVGLAFPRQMIGQCAARGFRCAGVDEALDRSRFGAWALARCASIPVPPAAAPTARSAAPVSPTCARTACGAAWPAAACRCSISRSVRWIARASQAFGVFGEDQRLQGFPKDVQIRKRGH